MEADMTDKERAHFEWLGLCGCGAPETAYNFCREALMLFDRRGEDFVDAEEGLRLLMHTQPNTAAHVFAHLLNHLNLIEHGGSVGGSWAIERGLKIIDMGPMADGELDIW